MRQGGGPSFRKVREKRSLPAPDRQSRRVRVRALEGAEGQLPVLPSPDGPVPQLQDQAPSQGETWQQELAGLSREVRQRAALDDVPRSIKRHLSEPAEEDDRARKRARVSESLVAQAAWDGNGLANEWVSRYEVELLRRLTGLPVTAARIHRQPRKRLARPPKLVSRGRLSILLGQDTKDYVVEETPEEVAANPRRRASFAWKGMTMYYRPRPRGAMPVHSYVEKDGAVYEVNWTFREKRVFEQGWHEEVKDILLSEVMLLKLKQGGRELDSKYFDDEERKAFEKSDAKEWARGSRMGSFDA